MTLMKKNDLKKIIKPLVKECIHEVLLEEGLLSGIVSEVAQGMQGAVLTESVRNQRTMKEPAPSQMRRKTQNANKKIQERKLIV